MQHWIKYRHCNSLPENIISKYNLEANVNVVVLSHLKYNLYFVTPETVLSHSWWSFPLCTPHVSVPWCSWPDICIIAVENDHFPRTARWHLPPWPSGSSHFTWTVHTCCSHYFPIFQSFCDLRWLVPSCFLNLPNKTPHGTLFGYHEGFYTYSPFHSDPVWLSDLCVCILQTCLKHQCLPVLKLLIIHIIIMLHWSPVWSHTSDHRLLPGKVSVQVDLPIVCFSWIFFFFTS